MGEAARALTYPQSPGNCRGGAGIGIQFPSCGVVQSTAVSVIGTEGDPEVQRGSSILLESHSMSQNSWACHARSPVQAWPTAFVLDLPILTIYT